MAKFTKEEFISGLKEMTILEVKELVDAMKEEFGVDPSAVAVATAVVGETATDDAPSVVDVILKEAGPTKLPVIKIIRDITGLGLKDAKDIADNGGVVKEQMNMEEANELKTKLEEAGASVELK